MGTDPTDWWLTLEATDPTVFYTWQFAPGAVSAAQWEGLLDHGGGFAVGPCATVRRGHAGFTLDFRPRGRKARVVCSAALAEVRRGVAAGEERAAAAGWTFVVSPGASSWRLAPAVTSEAAWGRLATPATPPAGWGEILFGGAAWARRAGADAVEFGVRAGGARATATMSHRHYARALAPRVGAVFAMMGPDGRRAYPLAP